MHRIEAQPVKAVVAEPVQRVFDGELAHFRHAKVDGAAPGRLRVGKNARCNAAEIIPFGPEVVVDDVEKHHQPARMRGVDQCLEILRPAVAGIRRERQHPVIAPVPAAGKIRQRHQLERGDARCGQVIEFLDRGAECALGRERADVNFREHRLMPGPSLPVRALPFISMIDDFARPRVRHPAGSARPDREFRCPHRSQSDSACRPSPVGR